MTKGHRRTMTTLNHEASSIIHPAPWSCNIIRSHYCNANGAFLFTPEDQLTIWTANCNSCYVILMELEVWLFSSVPFIMHNSVNNVRNLKFSFRNKSAASWMGVVTLRLENCVVFHNDICDIHKPMSFQVQLLVEDHVQWWALLLMAFKPSICSTLSYLI
jgi:hypothetical protein